MEMFRWKIGCCCFEFMHEKSFSKYFHSFSLSFCKYIMYMLHELPDILPDVSSLFTHLMSHIYSHHSGYISILLFLFHKIKNWSHFVCFLYAISFPFWLVIPPPQHEPIDYPSTSSVFNTNSQKICSRLSSAKLFKW